MTFIAHLFIRTIGSAQPETDERNICIYVKKSSSRNQLSFFPN